MKNRPQKEKVTMDFKVIESKTTFEGYIVDIRKDKIESKGNPRGNRKGH